MKLVYAVEKEVAAFKERWLTEEFDDSIEDWLEFINMAKGKPGQQQTFKNCQAFAKELDKIREDDSYLGTRVHIIAQLQRVVDSDKIFRELVDSALHRLDNAMNLYMVKYCLSFISELEELDVECVRDYENNINFWQAEIRDSLSGAEGAMANINAIGHQSFTEYISNYGQVQHFMLVALDCLTSVTDPFRSWVTADEGYLKKVSLEISALQRRKLSISALLRKDKSKIEESKSREIRHSFDNKLLQSRVKNKLKDRKYCRKREFSFVDKIERNENILLEKKFELHEAQMKVKMRPMHTLVREPSDGMTERCQKLQGEVNRMENYLTRIRRGKRDMRETRYQVQKEYHSLKVSVRKELRALRGFLTPMGLKYKNCFSRIYSY